MAMAGIAAEPLEFPFPIANTTQGQGCGAKTPRSRPDPGLLQEFLDVHDGAMNRS